MRLSVTKAINKILFQRFDDILLSGAFPKVEYQNTGGFKSYLLLEYSDLFGKFSKVADKRIKENLDPKLGIFTRMRSESFLKDVQKIVSDIAEFEIDNSPEHFRTLADDLRAEIGA